MQLSEIEHERQTLLGSLLEFTKIFYYKRTGRKFVVSDPTSRESHYITIMRELVKVSRLETRRLIINVPPGHGKSTMLQHFVAWTMARYPDSNFLYISYSKTLAEKHTATIKQIMELPKYKNIFNVHVSDDSSAKGNFKTTAGGCVMAFGSSGSITGQDAGLPNLSRFSGMVIVDDAHKPDEVHSDTIRQSVIDNYNETIKQRPRSENVAIVFLGQCLHEDDLAAYLKSGKDGHEWKKVILKAIDEAGNALCPNINSLEMLRIEERTNPYVFSAQFQQDPQPAGGGIFKPEWFKTFDYEPKIITTFITVDSAETDKDYNDATVFSFWGLYKVQAGEVETDDYALHWIDCEELRVEPKDLQGNFLDFYGNCCKHKIKPKLAAIEKKSTGVTLTSVLKEFQGLQILDIPRDRSSGSKIQRFLEVQPFVARKLVSLPTYGKHTKMCLEHMRKITANSSHRFDDIADTLADAIRIALIDKTIIVRSGTKRDENAIAKNVMSRVNHVDRLRKAAYER